MPDDAKADGRAGSSSAEVVKAAKPPGGRRRRRIVAVLFFVFGTPLPRLPRRSSTSHSSSSAILETTPRHAAGDITSPTTSVQDSQGQQDRRRR